MDWLLPLVCVLYSISPTDNVNPNAEDWWSTGSEIEEAQFRIDENGATLRGKYVRQNWGEVDIDIKPYNVQMFFNVKQSKATFDRFTGSGFLYLNLDNQTASGQPKPSFRLSCEAGKAP